MAKKENQFRGYDITTQAVHTGTDYDPSGAASPSPCGCGGAAHPRKLSVGLEEPEDIIADLDRAMSAAGL